ncbi:polysaccharide deacetylase family protein [bacterium]|nr:polysaccharide deacetylase family protein [bacterium]
MYHGVVRRPLAVGDWCFVSEADFRKQMEYLAQWFEVVALADLPEKLKKKNAKPLAAITFDDGYANNYEVAWPVLKKMGLPATIFLNTALVGGGDTVWFCRVNDALARTGRKEVEFEGERFAIGTAAEKSRAGERVQEILKTIPQERMTAACEGLIRALGDDPERAMDEGSPFRMLSAGQIAEMASGGLVEFGAHTRTHTIMAGISDRRLSEEIDGSIDEVEGLTGRPCRTFAYPNGRREDYDGRAVEILKMRGISAAVTTIGGPNDAATPSLELKRYGIGADMPWHDFKLEIHHVKSALRREG